MLNGSQCEPKPFTAASPRERAASCGMPWPSGCYGNSPALQTPRAVNYCPATWADPPKDLDPHWTCLPVSKNSVSLSSGHRASKLEILCSMPFVFKGNPITRGNLGFSGDDSVVLMRTPWQAEDRDARQVVTTGSTSHLFPFSDPLEFTLRRKNPFVRTQDPSSLNLNIRCLGVVLPHLDIQQMLQGHAH